jgi:hypothetical protein
MSAALRRDPIVRITVLLWAGLAALYFIPGVPHDFLERLGDRYSTVPLWPWAIAACLYGFGRVSRPGERRFWTLQAVSFAALLVIEVPWALARAGNTTGWNIAAEWCYFVYYGCQLASAVETRVGAAGAALASAAAAAALSVMAIAYSTVYDPAWPSYILYLVFDGAMAFVFWLRARNAPVPWAPIFSALAVTSAIVFATDVLDMLSYEEILKIQSGMKTDILWTLPPLCYALAARFGRQRLETVEFSPFM